MTQTPSENLTDLLARFNLQKREDWKYSDLKLFSHGRFDSNEAHGVDWKSGAVPENGEFCLVFVNGCFSLENFRINRIPEGLSLRSLAETAEIVGQDDNFLVALNTNEGSETLEVEIAQGVVLDQPLHIHFLTDQKAEGKLVASRIVVRAGQGSKATIIEHFEGAEAGEVLNVPVTQVLCAPDSDIRHLKVVREGNGALHLGCTLVRQEKGSRYTSREFALGGRMVRRELHLDLAGEDAACDLTALSMADGEERRDMRTRVGHQVSGCVTRELYKGIFDDQSRGVFDGKILVERHAQQTSAQQTNRNLLLSDDAVSYSIPRLEIYADDVKCSHGSTTGQLDEDQVFFLRSRGFDAETARVMLAKAFAGEILDGLSEDKLRTELDAHITARLGGRLAGVMS